MQENIQSKTFATTIFCLGSIRFNYIFKNTKICKRLREFLINYIIISFAWNIFIDGGGISLQRSEVCRDKTETERKADKLLSWFPSTNWPSFTVISSLMVLLDAAHLNAIFENHSIFHYALTFSFIKVFAKHASFKLFMLHVLFSRWSKNFSSHFLHRIICKHD